MMAATPHIKPVLLLSLLLVLISAPASAEDITITFSTVDFDTNQQILIYNSAGEFVGENSTTDTIRLNTSYSYLLIFRPTAQTWFENPVNSIEFLGIQMPVFLSYLVWVVVIVCVVLLVDRFSSGGKKRRQ